MKIARSGVVLGLIVVTLHDIHPESLQNLFVPKQFIVCGSQYASRVKAVSSFGSFKCRVSFVKDGKQIYLVKQPKTTNPFYSVREMVAGCIAEKVGIPAHQVRLIPAGVKMQGKHDSKMPATIHTVVPGDVASKAPKPFNAYLAQPIYKNGISKSNWGLTPRVIASMALHDDLPLIAAFDTFLSYGDRHRNNFFYDPQSNHYFAIDLESCYRHDGAKFTLRYIQNLAKTKKLPFTKQEQRALLLYRDTLDALLSQFPVREIDTLFDQFIKEAAFPAHDKDSYKSKVEFYKDCVKKNLLYVKQLVNALDNLSKRFKFDRSQDRLNGTYVTTFSTVPLASISQCVEAYKHWLYAGQPLLTFDINDLLKYNAAISE